MHPLPILGGIPIDAAEPEVATYHPGFGKMGQGGHAFTDDERESAPPFNEGTCTMCGEQRAMRTLNAIIDNARLE